MDNICITDTLTEHAVTGKPMSDYIAHQAEGLLDFEARKDCSRKEGSYQERREKGREGGGGSYRPTLELQHHASNGKEVTN